MNMNRIGRKLKSLLPGDIKDTDIVIALMGPTGSGKSTFIDVATEQDGKTVGHGLESKTSDIRAVRYKHPAMNEEVVLVDTPGFDDTHKPDTEILKLIAEWLKDTYKKDKKLTAILYLHRISDNRMAGSPLRNLKMFNQLCGDGALTNVVLVTTMWSKVRREVGEQRQQDLQNNFWKDMLVGDKAATTARFDMTYDSAWAVITGKSSGERHELLVQEEMVDLDRRLSETKAGKMLFKELQTVLAKQQETMRKLKEQAGTQSDQELVKELEREYDDMQERWRATLDEAQKMKIPIGRRLVLFFSMSKKPQSKPVGTPEQ